MGEKKKILILYSTAGMGHKKAALAVLEALRKRPEELDVESIDVIEYAGETGHVFWLGESFQQIDDGLAIFGWFIVLHSG